jgi:hypothetical protein
MAKYRIKEKMVWHDYYKEMQPVYRPQRNWFGLFWLPIYDYDGFFAYFHDKIEAEEFIRHEMERTRKKYKPVYHTFDEKGD